VVLGAALEEEDGVGVGAPVCAEEVWLFSRFLSVCACALSLGSLSLNSLPLSPSSPEHQPCALLGRGRVRRERGGGGLLFTPSCSSSVEQRPAPGFARPPHHQQDDRGHQRAADERRRPPRGRRRHASSGRRGGGPRRRRGRVEREHWERKREKLNYEGAIDRGKKKKKEKKRNDRPRPPFFRFRFRFRLLSL